MHCVVLLINCWLLQRHELSVEEHPPRSALAIHVSAHSVLKCKYAHENGWAGRTGHILTLHKGGGDADEEESSNKTHFE